MASTGRSIVFTQEVKDSLINYLKNRILYLIFKWLKRIPFVSILLYFLLLVDISLVVYSLQTMYMFGLLSHFSGEP